MGLIFLFIFAAMMIVLLGTVALVYGMTHPYRFTIGSAMGAGLPTSFEETGWQGEAVHFELHDGTRTPGWRIVGGKPDGPTLLWLHGFSSGLLRTLRAAEVFLPHVRAIVCYDQRAHGESEAKTFHFGHSEVFDALHVLKQLDPEDLKHGCMLLGKSVGAGIALETASELDVAGEKVCGVILEGPFIDWREPVQNLFRRKKYPAVPIIALARVYMHLRYPRLRRIDRLKQASRLNCPLLVLHGECDKTCSPETGRRIAQAAKQGDFVTIPEADHQALYDAAPSVYRQAIEKLFASIA